MANHNKNKKFGGSERVERVRKTRRVGQDALERERQRKLERGTVRPLPETDYDLLIDYTNLD
jgi:hypothetical protein